MKEEIEFELSENTILNLPTNLFYREIESNLIVISSDTANWIVLFNEEQKEIFDLLCKNKELGKILELIKSEQDFNFLISQIIDRNFLNDQKVKFNTPKSEGLYIYLTNACNLSCTHCYMYSGKPNINELDKEDWFKVIKNAQQNNIKAITFTGGEILKYKDWLDVIKFTKEHGMSVTVLTNGILWDKEKVEKSKKYIDEVQISLDGTNEELNSIIRGNRKFQKALHGVKLFVEAGVKTIVATTPTLSNIKEIEKTYVNFAKQLLTELDSENLYFKIAQKLITGRDIYANSKEDAKIYSKITRNLANSLYPEYSIRNFINNKEIGTGLKNCGYGGLSISSDGKFFLCNRVEELEPIATNKDDFESIVEKANNYYEWSSVDNVTPCKECELKYICGGGCRIDEYHFKGLHSNITATKPLAKIYCDSEHKEDIYLKMINAVKYTYEIE